MPLFPRSRRGTWLLAGTSFLVVALIFGSRISSWVYYRARGVEIDFDSQVPFRIDPTIPFIIELARGGGPVGMDSIWIDDTGTVNFHRLMGHPDHPEMATLRVPLETLEQIVDAVQGNGVMHLHAAYRDRKIADGPEWRFRVQQTGRRKTVECLNFFPIEMTQFASQLDQLLLTAGSASLKWAPEYP
jgi:hypothetical protein